MRIGLVTVGSFADIEVDRSQGYFHWTVLGIPQNKLEYVAKEEEVWSDLYKMLSQ